MTMGVIAHRTNPDCIPKSENGTLLPKQAVTIKMTAGSQVRVYRLCTCVMMVYMCGGPLLGGGKGLIYSFLTL